MFKRIISIFFFTGLLFFYSTNDISAKEITQSIEKDVSQEETKNKFNQEYICDGNTMPYALYTPYSVNENKKPLIVWLHGLGEVNINCNNFLNSGLPSIINNWELEEFDAYIICPHLTANWNTGRWCTEAAKDNLKKLIIKFINKHNVDTDRIIIIGHSLGGQGALYMANELQGYFSKCIVLSGYSPKIEISEITIPVIGYVGMYSEGEDKSSIYYMENLFSTIFDSQDLKCLNTSHGNVPKVAFSIDEDNNNKSDLIEWILEK